MANSPESQSPEPNTENSAPAPSFFAELKRRKVFRVAITYVIVAWIIIQVAAATFPGFEIPMWAFRFVVLMLILGFPVALVLAWAFELTPEGIKLTKKVDRTDDKQVSKAHNRKRNWLSLGFAAALPTLIFGTLALYFYLARPEVQQVGETKSLDNGAESGKSIAVLPFENRSASEDDAYFTHGFHDDLLTYISRIQDIRTISRTSVMGYRDTMKPMPQIGEELNVAHILEGGVQRAGNQIRINVQLIDAAKDEHVWAEIYTREMTAENVFAIQSEMATAIANELKAVLSPEEQRRLKKRPTGNLAALEAYFRASEIEHDQSTTSFERRISLYQEAIRLDPEFAEAHAKLAGVYVAQIYHSGLPVEVQLAKAEPLLDEALRLDPSLSYPHVVRGEIFRRHRSDSAAAKAAFEHALSLSPNDDWALQSLANFLFWDQEYTDRDRTLELMERVLEVNPGSLDAKRAYAGYLMEMDRFELAREMLSEVLEKYPNDTASLTIMGKILIGLGDYPRALELARRAYALDPSSPVLVRAIRTIYEGLGDEEKERFWLERYLAVAPDSEDALRYRLRLLVMEGRLEEADALWWREAARSRVRWDTHVILWFMGMADREANRTSAALKRWRHIHPELFDDEVDLKPNRNELFRAKDVALLLKANGEPEKASRLLQEAEREALRLPNDFQTRMLLAKIRLAQGRMTAAMDALENDGGRIDVDDQLLIYGQAEFEELRDEPRFRTMVRDARRVREEQREAIARMEANGELAPIPEL